MLSFRALQQSKSGIPVGYYVSENVVVVWNNNHQNNYATLQQAKDAFPNLTIIQ
jgi:hypothetical protein